MGERPRVAVVGLDHWYFAYSIVDALVLSDKAELALIADSDPARAAAKAEEKGVAESSGDCLGAVARSDIDIAIITTRTSRHAELSIAALKTGKHVMCNKPMALNSVEADSMIAAAASSEGELLILQGTWRYWPVSALVKQLVDRGEIGNIISARFWTRAPIPMDVPGADAPGWFDDPDSAAGGAFIDHGVYQVDLMEWFTDSRIRGFETWRLENLRHKQLHMEDFGSATGVFSNGVRAAFEESWISEEFSTGYELRGTKGEIVADTSSEPAIRVLNQDKGRYYLSMPAGDNVRVSIEHYLDYLSGRRVERPSDAEDGRRVLTAIQRLRCG